METEKESKEIEKIKEVKTYGYCSVVSCSMFGKCRREDIKPWACDFIPQSCGNCGNHGEHGFELPEIAICKQPHITVCRMTTDGHKKDIYCTWTPIIKQTSGKDEAVAEEIVIEVFNVHQFYGALARAERGALEKNLKITVEGLEEIAREHKCKPGDIVIAGARLVG